MTVLDGQPEEPAQPVPAVQGPGAQRALFGDAARLDDLRDRDRVGEALALHVELQRRAARLDVDGRVDEALPPP